ncbi:hypothetical protein [Paracoccus ravus]|uniref:hypothetical protein n=1 Tax=Paracoccus ravus TaxID=2447760 RepID=UPI00106DFE27|nr:hypothetical protein [Paracoccus ravus]
MIYENFQFPSFSTTCESSVIGSCKELDGKNYQVGYEHGIVQGRQASLDDLEIQLRNFLAAVVDLERIRHEACVQATSAIFPLLTTIVESLAISESREVLTTELLDEVERIAHHVRPQEISITCSADIYDELRHRLDIKGHTQVRIRARAEEVGRANVTFENAEIEIDQKQYADRINLIPSRQKRLRA